MHIYIDESGSFLPLEGARPKVSAVGALLVPSRRRESLFRAYKQLLKAWRLGMDEVKGSQLSEPHFVDVFRLLRRFGVLFEVVPIDVGSLCRGELIAHQRGQAAKITARIPETYSEGQIDFLHGLRDELEGLSPQLYVQWSLMIQLIERTIGTCALYHSLHSPRELNAFNWIIDAKQRKITPLERNWSALLPPIMSGLPHEKAFPLCLGADVSSLNRHYVPLEPGREQSSGGYDLRPIFRKAHEFRDSKTDLGLQLVDIVTSAITRAFNQTLQVEGWGMAGWIILARRPQSVVLQTLGSVIRTDLQPTSHQAFVIRQIDRNATSLWTGIDMEALRTRGEAQASRRQAKGQPIE